MSPSGGDPGEGPAAGSGPDSRGSSLAAELRSIRSWVDGALEASGALWRDVPDSLAAAVRHSLMAGGKRFRPALVRWVGEQLGANPAQLVAPAIAVELIHTYSLIHDDLPSMDDDDLRRGRPTCHIVHGEAMAILAGDALQAAAFQILAESPELDPTVRGECVRALAEGAGGRGMVGGQVLDIEAELAGSSKADGPGRVEQIHLRKTAALIEASARMGACVARADPTTVQAAGDYGRALGLCFQAADDLLDVTGDAQALGKTPGKDAAQDKLTLVATLGMDGARRRAEEYADLARDAARRLGCAPGGALLGLVDFVLSRSS